MLSDDSFLKKLYCDEVTVRLLILLPAMFLQRKGRMQRKIISFLQCHTIRKATYYYVQDVEIGHVEDD